MPTLTETKLGDKSTHIQTCASQVHGPPFKIHVSDFQTEETDSFKWSKFNIFEQLLSPFIFLKVFFDAHEERPWVKTLVVVATPQRLHQLHDFLSRFSVYTRSWEKRVVSTPHSFCSPSSSGSQRQPVGRHTESSLTKLTKWSARGPFYWSS